MLNHRIVMEFGHNDGGSLTPTDNGLTDCSPSNTTDYSATCTTVYEYGSCVQSLSRTRADPSYSNVTETVLTYEAYLANAATMLAAKGANVIISSGKPY